MSGAPPSGAKGVQSVCAVLVTYHPDIDRLERALHAVRGQVGHVVVVDNASGSRVREWLAMQSAKFGTEVMNMGENLGIAAAMNAGIEKAKARGFSEVLLLDHDSIPAPDMVERLAEAKARLQAEGVRVAAVGPEFRDEKYPGVLPFYRLDGWRIRRRSCAGSAPGFAVRAECLITSGSLISIEAVERIGPLESSLFVDYVDVEWGFRASSRGYLCFGVCGAVLDHQLGDAVKRVLGITAPVRSPVRHYYLFRNALLMFRRSYVPLRWKVGDAYRLLLKYVFYSLFAQPRLDHLRMMTLGIVHALINRSGRLA